MLGRVETQVKVVEVEAAWVKVVDRVEAQVKEVDMEAAWVKVVKQVEAQVKVEDMGAAWEQVVDQVETQVKVKAPWVKQVDMEAVELMALQPLLTKALLLLPRAQELMKGAWVVQPYRQYQTASSESGGRRDVDVAADFLPRYIHKVL